MEFEEKIRIATTTVLQGLGLSDRVKIEEVSRQPDSPRFDIDLKVDASEFPRFEVDPTEVNTAQGGNRITPESLEPFIRRELIRIFPDTATQL